MLVVPQAPQPALREADTATIFASGFQGPLYDHPSVTRGKVVDNKCSHEPSRERIFSQSTLFSTKKLCCMSSRPVHRSSGLDSSIYRAARFQNVEPGSESDIRTFSRRSASRRLRHRRTASALLMSPRTARSRKHICSNNRPMVHTSELCALLCCGDLRSGGRFI